MSNQRNIFKILVCTVSMFLVTHLIVFFYLFPVCTVRIAINPENSVHVKKSITGLLFRIIGQKINIVGAENIGSEKKYIIISNYPGSYAGFALMNTFPDSIFVVHGFFARVPVVGFLLKKSGAIFVQLKNLRSSIRDIDRKLKQENCKHIIIFPEGGRTSDGQIQTFKRGFVYMLRHSNMDLLPVTLNGFYRLKPLTRPYLDPYANLTLVIHKPISRSVIDNLNDEEIIKLNIDTIKSVYIP